MENHTEIHEEILQPEVPETPKKGLQKPILIGIIAGVLAVVIALAVVIYLNLPSTIYGKAEKCLQKEDFDNAIKYFQEVIDYEDAEAKCKEAYLGAGRKLVIEKDYDAAIEMLNKVESDEACSEVYLLAGKQMIADEKFSEALPMLEKSVAEDAGKYTEYANAMIAIGASEFDTAITKLTALGGFEDSADILNNTYYQKAEALYGQGSYSKAKAAYEKTNGFADVSEKVKNCDLMIAEEYYKDGDLKKAQDAFKKLPADMTFNNVSVSDRLATLDKHADMVKLCGTWKGTGGKMTVRQTHKSTGLWDQWTGSFTDSITVKCIINDDGTFTIKGTAKYYIYTNYSVLSKYLKTMEMSTTFSQTGKSIPKELHKSSLDTLTYSGGKFKLSFSLTDKNSSMNFKYKYTSSITYEVK
jgi:tetratricopeptide (TPR) repeat protein